MDPLETFEFIRSMENDHEDRTMTQRLFKTTLTVWTEEDPRKMKPGWGWVSALEYLQDVASNDIAACSNFQVEDVPRECFHGHGLHESSVLDFFPEPED